MSNVKLGMSKITAIVSVVLSRLLLDISYYFIIAPIYTYYLMGAKFAVSMYVCSWLLLIPFIPTICELTTNAKKMSDYSLLFMFLLCYIPFTTMAGFYCFTGQFIIYTLLLWVFFVFLHKSFNVCRLSLLYKRFFVPDIYKFCIMLIATVSVLSIVYISMSYRGFAVSFDLSKLYDIRAMAKNFKIPTFLQYIWSMASPIILLMIAYSLYKRKYVLAVLFSIVQVLNFGVAGHKIVALQLLVVWSVYFLYDKYLHRRIVLWFNFMLSVSVIDFVFTGKFYLIDYIIRRSSFLTNRIASCYFDFFTKNRPDYLSQSIMRHFGAVSKYPELGYMIGDLYFHRPEMHCDNGLMSDAITNYGMAGVIVMPILWNIVFCLFDRYTINFPKRFYVAFSFIVANSVIETFFFPALLTHGIAMLLISFWLISKIENTNMQGKQ